MRKFFVFAIVLFFSCSADEANSPTQEEFAEMILQNFEQHAKVIDKAIDTGSTILGNASDVTLMTQTVNSRDAFLGKMNDLTTDTYAEASAEWLTHLDRSLPAAPQRGFNKLRSYLLPYSTGYSGPNDDDALSLFQEEVDTKMNSGYRQRIVLKKISVTSNQLGGAFENDIQKGFTVSYP